MTNENFFKHDNKAYTENLNDAILIANAFNYQVPVNIPGMYNNNHYPNDNNIHKVGVADVTIVSSGSLSIGDTAITNNSNTSQVLRLRVYPNFNNFFSWKALSWTATGEISINICDAGTTTSLLPAGELTNPEGNMLSGIASLQGLKEYDLLITIPVNGVLNTLSIVFVNNWNSNNRVSASLSTSNVTGLTDALSTKVDKVTGKGLSTNDFTDTHKQGLESLMNAIVMEDIYLTVEQTPSPEFHVGTYSNQRLGSAIIENKLLIQGDSVIRSKGNILLSAWDTDFRVADLPASLKNIVRNKQSQISYSNPNLILELIDNAYLQIRNTGTTAISNWSISYNSN